jgi:hypothetical protein
MMVFAAVVQRVVDNDKHDSGGIKASTLTEFFVRFPDLYTCLWEQLKICVQESEPKQGTGGTEIIQPLLDHRSNVHPSLFPILLLLAKLRAPLSNDRSVSTSLSEDVDTFSMVDVSDGQLDSSVFLPLVESCLSFKLQKVREMAAKALVSLTCVAEVFSRTLGICTHVNSQLLLHITSRQQFGNFNNWLHGRMTALFVVLDSTNRHIGPAQGQAEGNVASSLDGTYRTLTQDIGTQLLPHLVGMVEYMCSCVQVCPAVHLMLFKALQTIRKMFVSCGDMSLAYKAAVDDLIGFECFHILNKRANIITDEGKLCRGHPPIMTPYLPLLLQEVIGEYVCVRFETLLMNYSGENSRAVSVAEFTRSCLVTLLGHPCSEVREGCLLGLQGFVSTNADLTNTEKKTVVVPLLQQLLDSLLAHVCLERKPSILNLSLALCAKLSSLHPFSMIDSLSSDAWERYWYNVACIVCYPAHARASAIVASSNVIPSRTSIEILSKEMVATEASGYALQVISHSICNNCVTTRVF